MSSRVRRAGTGYAGTGLAVVLGVSLLSGFGFTGCAAISAARKVVHDVRGNRATIDAFTHKMSSGEPASFQVTYVTTGSSPGTIVYAVRPPKGLAFKDTPSGESAGGTGVDLIVNPSGEYSCSPPASSGSGSGGAPSCQKLAKADVVAENKIFGFYTPTHWVTFLRDFSLAAGFAGDKVTSSTMTVNGYSMSCVDFRAAGVPGKSTVCTTAEGILGYVNVANSSTSFEIKSYSTTPSDSLFELPPGAKVVTVTTGT